jgi:copper resistance protein D
LTAVLIFVRFAHFASAMAVFGASVFVAGLSTPPLRAALVPAIGRLIVATSLIAAATAVFWLLLEGGEMGGEWSDAFDPRVLASVLADTQFGQVWRARLILALALVIVALWRPTAPTTLSAVLSGLFLASLGLVGHAAMRVGELGAFERANQAIHLLAGGFWLGALAPLVVCLRLLDDPIVKNDAALALRRFSGLGHVAVAAVLATGIVNTFVILGHLPLDLSSPYQTSLAVKIAAVLIMVLLALYNRYRLVPRLALGPAAGLALSRNTTIEIGLGSIVLALVSAFATFEPV